MTCNETLRNRWNRKVCNFQVIDGIGKLRSIVFNTGLNSQSFVNINVVREGEEREKKMPCCAMCLGWMSPRLSTEMLQIVSLSWERHQNLSVRLANVSDFFKNLHKIMLNLTLITTFANSATSQSKFEIKRTRVIELIQEFPCARICFCFWGARQVMRKQNGSVTKRKEVLTITGIEDSSKANSCFVFLK